MEKKFNLLDEPWILAMKPGGEVEEVSLLDVFRRAPEYRRLSGELPTQDVAIFRLLLAVMHSVFYWKDIQGNAWPEEEEEEGEHVDLALALWGDLWRKKSFPFERIEAYLRGYEDRFWLFHEKTPFYQVPELTVATKFGAQKLNGLLSESGESLNKVQKARLFPKRTGESRKLDFAESARWLLHVNAFDDTSAKPKGKGLPSPGAGWLGKLGLVMAEGDNLFETLMLNFVLVQDKDDIAWERGQPIWEVPVRTAERTNIAMPGSQAELLTLQSRRLSLIAEGDKVVGYMLLGGDFFEKENTFAEQMTQWRIVPKPKSGSTEFVPKRHDPSKQLWRDFAALTVNNDINRRPGIVSWILLLRNKRKLDRAVYRFVTASAKYGDKDFFIDDVFSDSVAFNVEMLNALGESGWVNRIIDELKNTESWVNAAGDLAANLAKAAGGDGSGKRIAAREQAYYRLDIPFREWLSGIDIDADMDETVFRWTREAQRIIRVLGRQLVNEAGTDTFRGREANNALINAPIAYNRFLAKTKIEKVG